MSYICSNVHNKALQPHPCAYLNQAHRQPHLRPNKQRIRKAAFLLAQALHAPYALKRLEITLHHAKRNVTWRPQLCPTLCDVVNAWVGEHARVLHILLARQQHAPICQQPYSTPLLEITSPQNSPWGKAHLVVVETCLHCVHCYTDQ